MRNYLAIGFTVLFALFPFVVIGIVVYKQRQMIKRQKAHNAKKLAEFNEARREHNEKLRAKNL